MIESSFSNYEAPSAGERAAAAVLSAQPQCEECLGSGGWFRYEPAMDPAPGMLYLSCMQCRGSGRTVLARD
jgi:hypothetical protein